MDYERKSTEYVRLIGKKNLIVAEIGVRNGLNALSLLKNLSIKELWLVDNFKPYFDGDEYVSEETQNDYEKELTQSVLFNYKQAKLIKQNSAVASKMFLDGYFDFVYIDANHLFDSVLLDLICWYPKIKEDGILAGHDYNIETVKDALYYFVIDNKLKLNVLEGDDWVITKTS